MNRLRRINQNSEDVSAQDANSWDDVDAQVEASGEQAEVATLPSNQDADTSFVQAPSGLSEGYTAEVADAPESGAPVLDTEAMPLSAHTDPAEKTPPDPIMYSESAVDGDQAQAAQAVEVHSADASEPATEEAAVPDSSDTAEDNDDDVSLGRTVPLTKLPERESLNPVPVNGTIDGRYTVQNQLHHGTDRNLYRVVADNQQRCLTCGRLSVLDAQTCGTCGSPLSNQQPADFYLMAESFRPESLMQDPSLMQLNLYHPSLVPVIDFFSDTPFGRARYYAVAEPRQGVRLSQLSMPRSPIQVLNWAMQLADALEYLHSRGVIGAGAEADDILVQGDRASLASLQNARAAGSNEADRAGLQSHDLARLASTIYEAYTGSHAAMNPDGMVSMPTGTPEPVGAAFRAAIEPVQGAGKTISAAQWRDLLSHGMEAIDELERPGKPVDFVSAGLTDVGRLREQNQDSFGMSEFVQGSAERPLRIGFYMIADGLGGHKGGEIASALSVQAFAGEVVGRIIAPLASTNSDDATTAPTNESILQGMTRAVQLANDRIYKARDNRRNDMGTTLVAAVISGGKAYIVNVGDSRIYLYTRNRTEIEATAKDATRPLVKGTTPFAGTVPLRSQEEAMDAMPDSVVSTGENGTGVDGSGMPLPAYELTQVSIDHSLVHRLVELGQLNAEEAKVHPHRNFIYRSLGGPPPIEVDTFVRTLHPGDRLLLCSDGLNSMVDDPEIEEILATEPDPHAACRKLIDLANGNGGHDNITTVIIDITEYLPTAVHPFALMGQ